MDVTARRTLPANKYTGNWLLVASLCWKNIPSGTVIHAPVAKVTTVSDFKKCFIFDHVPGCEAVGNSFDLMSNIVPNQQGAENPTMIIVKKGVRARCILFWVINYRDRTAKFCKAGSDASGIFFIFCVSMRCFSC